MKYVQLLLNCPEVQHAKLFEVRGLHRFHGIGDMAACINADIAKRLGSRHSTDAEGIENIKKTLHIKCCLLYTSLLEDHRTCLVAVAPVAAHKGVRLVPVADVLVCRLIFSGLR